MRAVELAKYAVQESGIGLVEDKVRRGRGGGLALH